MKDTALSLFPYQPYEIQREFVRNFLEIVKGERIGGLANVGILESPTGTGKTTSLLCAALSWIISDDHKGEDGDDDLKDILASDSSKEQPLRTNPIDNLKMNEPEWVRQTRMDFSTRPLEREKNPRIRSFKRKKTAPSSVDDSIQKLLSMVKSSDSEGEEVKGIIKPVKRVYYCSRTHSQLTQVMSELAKIVNGKKGGLEVKAITLSARKTSCINPQVVKLGSAEAINEKCQDLLSGGDEGCRYYNDDKEVAMKVLEERLSSGQIVDIEELIRLGREHQACPYYASRSYSTMANILTVPYNMVLSRTIRDAMGIDLRGALVIFDEGHNLVDTINGLNSCSVTSDELELLTGGLRIYIGKFEGRLAPTRLILLQQLQHIVTRISNFLKLKVDEAKVWLVNSFLVECGIDHINMLKIVDYIKERSGQGSLSAKIANYYYHERVGRVGKLLERTTRDNDGSDARIGTGDINLLSRFGEMLTALAAADTDGRLVLSEQGDLLKYIALNPAKVMEEICSEAQAVILAGGTMRPIDDVAIQLFSFISADPNLTGIQSFSYGHVADPHNNILGLIVGNGPGGSQLRFTQATRGDTEMMVDLSQTFVNICNIVPDGVAAFFPSYEALDHFLANWSNRSAIEAKKKIFIETLGMVETESFLKGYQGAILEPRGNHTGAFLLAVMGGRLSEGVNFSDRLARAVIVVGQPFPNINDPETKERAANYSRLRGVTMGESQATTDYLENICIRTVNQTIGRAIRHAQDYAAIIFLDHRYGSTRIRGKLPTWIQPALLPQHSGVVDFSFAFGQLVNVFTTKFRQDY